jgi:hypothetical protein
MSAVAALAIASPAAVVAVSDLSDSAKPPTQHRQFVQAATITDLPNALISALSQGLSQFGINLPPMPTGLLTGSDPGAATTLTPPLTPGLGTSPLTTPLTPGLGTSPLTPPLTPGLGTSPLTTPLTPGLGTSPLTTPDLGTSPLTPGALSDVTNPALTPALPTGATPLTGLSTPPADASLLPISPAGALPAPGDVPIAAPIGLGPPAGTYPIDPSLAAIPATTSGGGGLLGDVNSAFTSLGGGQAIDLLKGVLLPAIMSAAKPAGAPAADAAAAATSAIPAAAAALPAS